MAPGPRRREAISRILVATGSIMLCACLLAFIIPRAARFAAVRTQGAWSGETLRASSGALTITAPSRETVHTTVNHGLGNAPVVVLLGLDTSAFDYYEFIDDPRESGGGPAERPIHVSAVVRKPYNGTFTIRLKHLLGTQRTFTVRWLTVQLEGPVRAATPGSPDLGCP